MLNNAWQGAGHLGPGLLGLSIVGPVFLGGLVVVVLWSLFWKAWALWLAARRGEKIWFGVLLVLNTVGILEIIYIFLVAKRRDHRE